MAPFHTAGVWDCWIMLPVLCLRLPNHIAGTLKGTLKLLNHVAGTLYKNAESCCWYSVWDCWRNIIGTISIGHRIYFKDNYRDWFKEYQLYTILDGKKQNMPTNIKTRAYKSR